MVVVSDAIREISDEGCRSYIRVGVLAREYSISDVELHTCSAGELTYSPISIAQKPVPQPISKTRPLDGTGHV